MSEILQRYCRVVAEVLFHQVGIIIGRAAISDGIFYFLHIGNFYCGCLSRIDMHGGDTEEKYDSYDKMFHLFNYVLEVSCGFW